MQTNKLERVNQLQAKLKQKLLETRETKSLRYASLHNAVNRCFCYLDDFYKDRDVLEINQLDRLETLIRIGVKSEVNKSELEAAFDRIGHLSLDYYFLFAHLFHCFLH